MTTTTSGNDVDVWVRRVYALVVAAVAAYASYEHQREFVLRGGAEPTSAGLWSLSVDGLLVLATVGLLKSSQHAGRRVRVAVWSSFSVGSLAADIAAAPTLAWLSVLVAGWPLVALLLAAELLARWPRSADRDETDSGRARERTDRFLSDLRRRDSRRDQQRDRACDHSRGGLGHSSGSRADHARDHVAHVLREQACGRIPTGASWIGSPAPPTTGAWCCANGASKAVSLNWIGAGRPGSLLILLILLRSLHACAGTRIRAAEDHEGVSGVGASCSAATRGPGQVFGGGFRCVARGPRDDLHVRRRTDGCSGIAWARGGGSV